MDTLTPRHIQQDESNRLGIKHGWYGIKVNGTLMTGPSVSRADCLEQIDTLTDPTGKASARRRAAAASE